jgi:hypothetical protein
MQSSLPYLGISSLINHANETLYWMPSDSPGRFETNKQLCSDRLSYCGWTEHSITYTHNEFGFRADSFDGEGIIFLGCSLTYGIGMIWENTWAYLVAKELGLKCWNLGIGGSSNDAAFRYASYWIPKLKPRYVCYMPTFKDRVELITPEKIDSYCPAAIPSPDEKDPDSHRYYQEWLNNNSNRFYKNWVLMTENGILNEEKNLRAIESVCVENDIPLIIQQKSTYIPGEIEDDMARDLVHPGKSWNTGVAKLVLSKISKIS